jgi:hypothetical protein
MTTSSDKGMDNSKRVEDVGRGIHIGETSSGELNTIDKMETYQELAAEGLSAEEQKRVIRKVDWRVVPLLTFLYLVSFLDRSNSTFSPLAM